MSRPATDSDAVKALKDDFERWTKLIESHAWGRTVRAPEDSRSYETLYRRLIASCQTLEERTEEPRRHFYQRMESTVRPWLSLTAITKTDGEILGRLLDDCRGLEREFGSSAGNRVELGIIRALFLIIPATIGFLAGSWATQGLASPLIDAIRHGWGTLSFSLRRTNDLENMLAVGVVLMVLAIYSLSRTARS